MGIMAADSDRGGRAPEEREAASGAGAGCVPEALPRRDPAMGRPRQALVSLGRRVLPPAPRSRTQPQRFAPRAHQPPARAALRAPPTAPLPTTSRSTQPTSDGPREVPIDGGCLAARRERERERDDPWGSRPNADRRLRPLRRGRPPRAVQGGPLVYLRSGSHGDGLQAATVCIAAPSH